MTVLIFTTSLVQVKFAGINFTTSQIDWNKTSQITVINLTTSQIEWNKLYYKSN